jgi:ERCC4-type nuclease
MPADDKYLIAPSEPITIKKMGRVSAIPEKHGADIFWINNGKLHGIQRKEFGDLLNSVEDGRLAREVQQLQHVHVACLIVEGKPRWTSDGHLMDRYHQRWQRSAYRSLLRSVQGRGIFVEHSDSTADTVALVEEIRRWTAKGDHVSLDRRPKPKVDKWGRITDEAWACHLLQSIDGIGPKQAAAVWKHFGERLPIALTATYKELLAVDGIGPKTADMIMRSFARTHQA